MKRFSPFLAAALLSMLYPQHSDARQLSPDEARDVAERFQNKEALSSFKKKKSEGLKLVYTAKPEKLSSPAYYVFNRGDNAGFIITSADDRLKDVIGYSCSGNFDMESIPENLKWLLDSYEREITAYLEYNESNPADSPVSISTSAQTSHKAPSSWNAISPLVTAQWGQEAPYNDMCPYDGGERSLTGCTATAMAQILKYHQYPKEPGSEYIYYTTEKGETVGFDFGVTFDWDNMLDDYTSGSTYTQQRAVAQLMLACGASTLMEYSAYESTAYNAMVSWGLVKYFGYDADARLILRDAYSSDEWEEIIYRELAERRPVLMDGYNEAGYSGHAFVCDGYDGNGYFHINWGWSGDCNSYFSLSALNPSHDMQYNFSYNVGATIGIEPPQSDSKGRRFNVFTDGSFKYAGSNRFHVDGYHYMWYPEDQTITWAIEVVPASGGESIIFESGEKQTLAALPKGYNRYVMGHPFEAVATGLTPGDYLVYPAYVRSDGTWSRLICPITKTRHVDLKVGEDGSLSYNGLNPDEDGVITVTQFSPQGKLYPYQNAPFTITVANKSKYTVYDAKVKGNIVNSNNPSVSIPLEFDMGMIDPDDSRTFNITLFFTEEGVYNAYFTDAEGNDINGEEFKFNVGDNVEEGYVWISGVKTDKFYSNYPCALDFKAENTTSTTKNINMWACLFQPGENISRDMAVVSCSLPADSDAEYEIENINFTRIPAGSYELMFISQEGQQLSDRFPVTLYAQHEDGVWYGIENNSAEIVQSPYAEYSGSVLTIPSYVSAGGVEYPVESIKESPFASLPDLRSLIIEVDPSALGDVAAIFPALPENVALYVRDELYDRYNDILIPLGRSIYSIIDKIGYRLECEPAEFDVDDEIKVILLAEPASPRINPNFSVSISDNLLEKTTQTPGEDGSHHFFFKAVKEGEGILRIESEQASDIAVEIPFTTKNPLSGISNVNGLMMSVSVVNGEIVIEGAVSGSEITLNDIYGRKVAECRATSDTMRIRLQSGIYVVSVGDVNVKVRL